MKATSHQNGPTDLQALAAFDHQPRTRVVFGVNAVDRAGELACELGAKKVLLVTDPGIVAAGHAERVHRNLEAAGLQVTVFDRARENPTTRCVDDCVALARAAGIDTLVGLGGGSSMDTAKGCNFLVSNGGRMQDYWGLAKLTSPCYPCWPSRLPPALGVNVSRRRSSWTSERIRKWLASIPRPLRARRFSIRR